MSTNVVNRAPFIRTSREIPEDLHQLTVEVNRAYVDIAEAVNRRTIGLFPTNQPAITGESWFLTSSRQQTLRQIYSISSYAPVTHGINFSGLTAFSTIRATGFDGTNYFPIPFINGANTVGIFVSPTQIQFIPTGVVPAIVSGIVILEWLSNV